MDNEDRVPGHSCPAAKAAVPGEPQVSGKADDDRYFRILEP